MPTLTLLATSHSLKKSRLLAIFAVRFERRSEKLWLKGSIPFRPSSRSPVHSDDIVHVEPRPQSITTGVSFPSARKLAFLNQSWLG